MRAQYGRFVYGPTRLPAGYARKSLTAPLGLDVGETLSFGADARATYIDQRPGDPSADKLATFFVMQADFYAAFHPLESFTLYYDQGAYGSFEAFGLYEVDLGSPRFSAYCKVGRFMPTFGLRIPNHNVFTRQEIGFGPRDKDVGAELGFNLGPLLIQGGILNGAGPEQKLDENSDKALVGRIQVLLRASALRLMAGGSAYYNHTGKATSVRDKVVDTRTTQLRGGVHWGAALGRFAYLGEADLIKVIPAEANTQDRKQYAYRSFQELAVLLVRGLDLTFNYEYRDADREVASGTAHRISGGFEFYPLPGIEILALYRHSIGFGPAEQVQDDFNEGIGMIHLFF